MRNTKVYLLSVPLENDYKHTLYFTDKSNQTSYFESKAVHRLENVSYQRKDSFIRVPLVYDKLLDVNYIMFQNSDYNNKWFYGFITDIEYVSDGLTKVNFETDVIQTWMFDYQIKPSFVEREHVNDDIVGKHTQPESLETGDYIVNRVNRLGALNETCIVMASTIDPTIQDGELVGGAVSGGAYGGVTSGYKYYTFENDGEKLKEVLKAFSKAGKSDAIGMLFIAPKKLVLLHNDGDEYDDGMVKETYYPISFQWTDYDDAIKKLTSLNGYTPRNKKLLCYPYTYLAMTNNNGGNAIFKHELFNHWDGSDTCQFEIYGTITPSMDIMLAPKYYNGVVSGDGSNFSEVLPAGKYPICGWTCDAYTNWLTQNAMNIVVGATSSAFQIAGGVGMLATGGGAVAGASSILGGSLGIASLLGEKYQHSLVPHQAEGNVNSGNIKYATKNNTFTAYQMSIKQEYAKVIDGYFDMFGYNINLVKVPNKAHRSRYWFTKTRDVNIDGAIPMKDMQKIKDCYNNGITFWRNSSEIGNYSLSNGIV